jgi:outer membrane lipoprotein LolB
MRPLFLPLLMVLLSACSTTPRIETRSAQGDAPFAFNGRVAVIQGGRHDSAGVRWTHRSGGDEVLLLAPLGQVVARIVSDAQGVTLENDGHTHTAHDAEMLTQRLLGWELPLSGLRHWLTAAPAPAGGFRAERDGEGRMAVLHQHGWTIRYARYASTAADALPLRMDLRREGLELRVVIDEWEMR